MYKSFFSLKERPFQLVPNPAYLFLGHSHEEALAHLSYAVSEGDGFVEITGEVGTGKTTLCRVFLESLDDNTEAALIFNPMLDATQLLKAISDEFGLPSDTDNKKELIDSLNRFLMDKKVEGKKIIVVIDEAQNLSKDVLEQLRLLSNLETTTSKLMQIILVGQPELRELLDSRELRQLAQRITLSCHITPLTFQETRDYILHRIEVASKKPVIQFTQSAFRAIYKYSGGVPRLINIAADRSLLTAYGYHRAKITGNIARTAIRELASRGEISRFYFWDMKRLLPIIAVCGIVLAVAFLYPFGDPGENSPSATTAARRSESNPKVVPKQNENTRDVERASPIDPTDSEPQAVSSDSSVSLPETVSEESTETGAKSPERATTVTALNEDAFEDFFTTMALRSSRQLAYQGILDTWNTDAVLTDQLVSIQKDWLFFRLAGKQKGLLVEPVKGNLALIKKLNLPGILLLYLDDNPIPGYFALVRVDGEKLYFKHGEGNRLIEIGEEILDRYWRGECYVFWKNFLNIEGTIPTKSSTDSILSLKLLLTDIGYEDIEMSPIYDGLSKKAVEEIQQKNGITVDGIVGPLTKIILYNELKTNEIPHLF